MLSLSKSLQTQLLSLIQKSMLAWQKSTLDLVAHANQYITALDDIEAAKELLNATSDPEEKEMLQEDIAANEEMLPQLEDEIKVMLIPGDPNDEKDTIVEIRAGVGGNLCRRPLQNV